MTETRSSLWSRNRLDDGRKAPARPLVQMAALGVAVLLVDVLLALGLRTDAPPPDREYTNARQVRDTFRAARDCGAPAWMLFGDSVLAGNSVRQEVPDWYNRRVLDYMRAEKRPDAPERFFQVAVNGLILTDIRALIRELDRVDPKGKTGVVIELNRRFFSPAYSEQSACTRPWLDTLAPELIRDGNLDWVAYARSQGREFADLAARFLPVVRFRDALVNPLAGNRAAEAIVGAPPVPVEDEFAVNARMYEHFRTAILDGEHAHLEALDEILARLRRTGRPTLFFTPPLSDKHAKGVFTEQQYGADLGRLAARIEAGRPENIALAHFDHPLFSDDMFKDIAHMFPEGNRLLAINLLHTLGVPLAREPRPEECVYPEGPDTLLTWNLGEGDNDGASWQAAFDRPAGMDIAPDGRIVIADSGNHCLRELIVPARRVPPSENAAAPRPTVRRIAGNTGAPPKAARATCPSGPADTVWLEDPASPCMVGDAVYFTVNKGQRLQRLENGHLYSELPLSGPMWHRIECLRHRGGTLYLLDEGHRVLAYDPRLRETLEVVDASKLGGVRTFDVSGDGRIFLADGKSRIWAGTLGTVCAPPATLALYHANQGIKAVPDQGYFPFFLPEYRFEKIVDLRYVQRYNALLAADCFPMRHAIPGMDERLQLRLISMDRHLVYPWTRPNIAGAYIAWNAPARTYASLYHEGSLAFDTASCDLFLLEKNRSRLTQMGDGLWGAARIGQCGLRGDGNPMPDLFGFAMGAFIQENHGPERYLPARMEPVKRSGPFTGILYGPSIVSTSDLVPSYSLVRAIETRLSRRLGLCDGLRFDLVARSRGGMEFEEELDAFNAFIELGGRTDAAIFVIREFSEEKDKALLADWLATLQNSAERFDTQILFLDLFAFRAKNHEPLLMHDASYHATVAAIQNAGFTVVDLGGELSRAAFDAAPLGCPPYNENHASPWAIDAAAEILAAKLHPLLAAHLRNRLPALMRSLPEEETSPETLLAVFGAFDLDWNAESLTPITSDAIQRIQKPRYIELYLDLGKLGAETASQTEANRDDLAYALLCRNIAQDLSGRTATSVRIVMASFSNYDEYGQGVRDTAKVVYDTVFDRESLLAFLKARFPGHYHEPPATEDPVE